jgi:hypothetical protein
MEAEGRAAATRTPLCMTCRAQGANCGHGAVPLTITSGVPSAICTLTPFVGYEIVGTRLSTNSTPTEAKCLALCCFDSSCLAYSNFTLPIGSSTPCILLSTVTSIVPSTIMSGGVRPSVLGL